MERREVELRLLPVGPVRVDAELRRRNEALSGLSCGILGPVARKVRQKNARYVSSLGVEVEEMPGGV